MSRSKFDNWFDLRRIIGALFLFYGSVLVGLGVLGSAEVKNKAAGINVDLWTGLAMLAVGAAMLLWALRAPAARPKGELAAAEGSAPPTGEDAAAVGLAVARSR